MRRITGLVLVAAAVALLLSACNNFIPAQTLNNPLGLNGQSLTLNTISTAALGTQATTHTAVFQGSLSTTIQDPDLSQVPGWAHPNGFSTGIDAGSVVLRPGDATTLPSSLTVTRTQVSLGLTDGNGSPSLTWTDDTGATAQQLLTLTRASSCGATTAAGCTYTVQAGPDLQGALEQVTLTSAQTSTLWTILGGGASQDDVSLDATVTAISTDMAVPSGTQMVITLDDAQGTLTFH